MTLLPIVIYHHQQSYYWTEDADGVSSVKTTMDPAPEVILQSMKCACTEKNKVYNTHL